MTAPRELPGRLSDPSLALALASMVRTAQAEGGVVTFGSLAVHFREDYLDLHRDVTGDLAHGSALSVDDARRHLIDVLPRLTADGFIDEIDGPLADDTPVRWTEPIAREVEADAPTFRERLLETALGMVRESESVTHQAPAETGGATLAAARLTKSYKRRRVVDEVDLELRQGEIVGLLGPNGAGKTTTFYMIVGLVRPDGGDIYLDGENIRGLPMYRRARLGIGYLAQEPSIFRKLSVEDNVMAILQTLKISRRERRERLERLLDELGIKHLRKTLAYQLSGGERRRLEITRALVTSPKFMLLDEPFAGVDPIAVHDIQTIVAGLRRRGIGVLITDHNVEQTLDIVDRAYIMFEGKVQVSGSVEELVMDDRVADLYLGPTLTARLRERLGVSA